MNKLTAVIGVIAISSMLASMLPQQAAADNKAEAKQRQSAQSAQEQARRGQAAAESLEQAVKQWVDELSRQDRFKAWKDAGWTSEPLGPGTHGWIVHIVKNKQVIGYMIVVVSSEDGGYVLSEYGLGKHAMYSLETLYHAMIQQELIPSSESFETFKKNKHRTIERVYIHPLLALWFVSGLSESAFFDAKNGEWLPIDEGDRPVLEQLAAKSVNNTKEAIPARANNVKWADLLLPAFDPYEKLNWVKGTPLTLKSFDDLSGRLRKSAKVTFTAEMLERRMRTALPIIGYNKWPDGSAYAAAEQDGLRYIRFDTLQRLGYFYE